MKSKKSFSFLLLSLLLFVFGILTAFFVNWTVSLQSKQENTLSLVADDPIDSVDNEDFVLQNTQKTPDYETENGVLSFHNGKLIYTSYLFYDLWSYELFGPESFLTKKGYTKDDTVVKAKYDSFSKTIVLYGFKKSANIKSFLFQLDEQTGHEIKQFSSNNPFIEMKDYQIDNILVNPGNGNVFLFPKTDPETKYDNLDVYVIDVISHYFSVQHFKQPQTEVTFGESTEIISVFPISNKHWGMMIFYGGKNTGVIKNQSKLYLLAFSYNLKLVAWIVENFDDQYSNKTNNYSPKDSIAQPFVLPIKAEGYDKFLIITLFLNDIRLTTSKNDVANQKSFYFSAFKFDPNNEHESVTGNNTVNKSQNILHIWNKMIYDSDIGLPISKNTVTTTIDESKLLFATSIKRDLRNKAFYISGFKKKQSSSDGKFHLDYSQVFIKKFAIFNENSSSASTLLGINQNDEFDKTIKLTKTNKISLPLISVINDEKIGKNNKSFIFNQNVVFNSTKNNKEIETTIESNQKTINTTGHNDKPAQSYANNNNTLDNWPRVYKDDVDKIIGESENFEKLLPSDISETTIKNLVKFESSDKFEKDDHFKNIILNKQLLPIEPEEGLEQSLDNKKLFNNDEGRLKAIVETSLQKPWYDRSNANYEQSKIFDITEIDYNKFGSIEKLNFQLVTSPSVDNKKWVEIKKLMIAKKPSEITVKDVFNNFIVKGEKVNITENDINVGTSFKESKLINVTPNDQQKTLRIDYNLKNIITSPSLPINNIHGFYIYDEFYSEALNHGISLNENKFNDLKKHKLPTQITVDDMLGAIKYSSLLFEKDRWKIVNNNIENSSQYMDDLINGNANFTLEYKRPEYLSPSMIADDYLKLKISSSTKDGSGFKSIKSFIFETKFNQEIADKIVINKDLNYLKNNVDNLLTRTVHVQNRWYDSSNYKAVYNSKKSNNKKAFFDLSLVDNEIKTNIDVFLDGINSKKLVLNTEFIKKLSSNKVEINLLKEVNFKYNELSYKWNFGIENDGDVININELVKRITEETKNDVLQYHFNKKTPVEFVDFFNEKKFNDLFPLIKQINENSNDLFQILDVSLVPNNHFGSVNVKYQILFKNNTSVIEQTVSLNVTINGFKKINEGNTNNDLTKIIIGVSVSVLLVFLLIVVILIYKKKIRIRKPIIKRTINSVNKPKKS